jgi:hypothetical protein
MKRADAKKVRERRILDLIYADRSVVSIIPSERPDFIIGHPNRTTFGVEITEFYNSETDARMERIPDYNSELLGGSDFRHRDDARRITLSKVDILTANNEVFASQIDSIIQKLPSLFECSGNLAAIVRGKAEKLAEPQVALSHVNLIVHDRTRVLGHMLREDFFHLYFLSELRATIAASPFREVFFLTKMKDESGFIPLKMLLLMAEAFFFNAIYTSRIGEMQHLQPVNEFELFASYLAGKVHGLVLFREAEDGPEVIFGDSGFLVAPDRSPTIRFYQDGTYPDDARPPNLELASQLGKEFMAALAEHWTSNTFVTPLLFPTKRFAE